MLPLEPLNCVSPHTAESAKRTRRVF